MANRHEWLSAFSGEVGVAQLVEGALGIEVPEAAQWLRTLLLEFNRVTSHLACLGGFPWTNRETVDYIRASHEQWVNHYQVYTGSRMHPMLTRVGGLAHAPDDKWLGELKCLCVNAEQIMRETHWNRLLESCVGIGVLSKSDAMQQAISGPAARASGYGIDARETASSLKYQELASFEVVVQTASDV